MTRFHGVALAALALILAPARLHAAGEGRILGTVLDAQDRPLQGARILVTLSDAPAYKQEKTSDKAGKFTLLILDATRRYTIHIEKEGFQPFEEALQPKLQDTLRIDYRLTEAAAGAAPDSAEAKAQEARNAAILAFNEGVAQLTAGDQAAAVASFEQAVKLDPDRIEAHGALARLYLDQQRFPQAIAAAERVLQAKPGDPGALTDLYDAVLAAGDKARADGILGDLARTAPGRDTAIRLLNKGALDYNESRMQEALAAFQSAEQADPSFPKTQYMLGLVHVSLGDRDKAQEHLARFLEMDPNDKDAATAKEMLEALKK